MRNQIQKLSNRTLAMILAIVMIVGMMPTSAFATGENPSSVTTTLPGTLYAGVQKAFSVTTTAGDNENAMVLGYLELSSWDGVTLEYKEGEAWYVLPQGVPFGPPVTGFPLGDKTSEFRVNFANPGTYTFTVSMKTAEETPVTLCSVTQTVTVKENVCEIESTIDDNSYVIGEAAEFTVTTHPNGQEDTQVYGKFTFSDWDAVETLEYKSGEEWYPLPRDTFFGPSGTGFPLKEATSHFRVTFNQVGTYSCTVEMVEAADTTKVVGKTFETNAITVVEKTPPVVESISAGTEWAKSATVTGTATDEGGSGVAKVVYSTDAEYSASHAAATIADGSFSFTVTANGTYHVWAVDGNGNVSEAKSIEITNVDTVAPVLLKAPESTDWTNTEVTVQVEASDEGGSGLAKVVYGTGDTFNADLPAAAANEDGTYSITVSENGTYYIWAVDVAGNESVQPAAVQVQIDRDAPQVVGVTAEPVEYTNGKVTVTGTASDEGGSKLAKVVYSTNETYGEALTEATLTDGSFSFEVSANATYYIWAVDVAGNPSEEAIEIAIKNIDKANPTVDSAAADPAKWTNGKVTVSGNVSDKGVSGVAQVAFQYGEVKGTATLTDGTYTFVIDEVFNGTCYVWAVDNAGNASEKVAVAVKIERTVPTVTAAADINEWTKEKVTISGTASDEGGAELDKIKYQYGEVKGTATLKDGTYTFEIDEAFVGTCYVWSVDNAGNESEKAEVEVKIERTIPEITAAADIDAWTNAQKVTVSGTAADKGGADIVQQVFYNTTGIYTDEKTPVVLNEDGTYTFDVVNECNAKYYVWSVDSVGNVSAPAEVQVRIDRTKPTAKVAFEAHLWESFFEKITFGLYKPEEFEVDISAKDNASGVRSIYYTISAVPMTLEDLNKCEQWQKYDDQEEVTVSVKDAQNAIVYVRVYDRAGNVQHFNSDGIILDTSDPQIKLTSDAAGENEEFADVYNDNVDVYIDVKDSDIYSGIKYLEYWITAGGKETKRETLYDFGYDGSYEGNIPVYADLVNSWNGKITVSAEENNSSDVVVTVQVTDNAGRTSTETVELDIDVTDPSVAVKYEDEGNLHNEKFFDGNRTAIITVIERANHFVEPEVYINEEVPEGATNYIKITATNGAGESVTFEPEITWTTVENADPDQTTHEATIEYNVDANYTFEMKVMDAAENSNTEISTTGKAPYEFTVDNKNPEGIITITPNPEKNNWEKVVDALTFGIFDKEKIVVSLTANDDTTPVKVEYFYQEFTSATAATLTDPTTITEWDEVDDNKVEVTLADGQYKVKISDLKSVEPNKQFMVYVKLTDNAGRITYLSTNGAIVDNENPGEPEISVNEKASPKHGDFYTDNVYVDIAVADVAKDGVYSGLNKITYRIVTKDTEAEDVEPLEEGILFSLNSEDVISKSLVKDSDDATIDPNNLVSNWKGQLVIDANTFNSNNVYVEVVAIDNAGNDRPAVSEKIMIDITHPLIKIEYDNNNNSNGKYYRANRTATITITERNFDPADVVINITNTDRVIPELPIEWTTTAGTELNGDDTTHTATIKFDRDGDYEFFIACTDLAGWTCGNIPAAPEADVEVTYDKDVIFAEGTQNATAFTIDKTVPDVTVSYDNNDAANEKYFKGTRTATVTIVEHNFSGENEGYFTITTDRGGENPEITWRHAGDVHIATIAYTVDGDYTFEVSVNDLAGNYNAPAAYGTSMAANDFVIDTNYENMITIGGVENGKAYGYDADVVPTLDISDINLEEYNISLIGIQKDTTINLTDKVYELLNAGAENVTGTFDIFEVIQNLDGIYTLAVTAQDKAGNQDSEQVIFTVNRFGSVYVYNEYLMNLIVNGGSYVQSVDEDLVISEYNADKLLSDSLVIEITRDGKPLDNVIVDVTPEINDKVAVGESGWYQYTYTIAKENFTTDGVYKISVSSKDATGNAPENNKYEGLSITFRVDSTPAEISSIVGLEESIVNATEQEVKYTVYDTMGIKSVKVYVNGELIHDITDFSEDSNNYSSSFVLTEQNSTQTVRIVIEDKAGNITDTDAETFSSAYEFNGSVTVSTNIFVRWYANKPLFWGSIGGTVVVAAGLWFFLAAKRKKKEELVK